MLLVRGPGITGLLAALSMLPAGTAEALPPVAESAYSEIWASVGIRYNHNLSINPDRIELSSSPVQEVSFSAYDDRALGDWQLRSLGTIDVFTDLIDHDRDFQVASASTGPVFELGEDWRLHTALGGWGSFFGYQFYTGLSAAYLTLERLDSPFRAIEVDAGVEHFGKEFGGDNVPWVDLFVDFGWDGLRQEDDWMDGQLYLEHYHADEGRFRYSQVALTLGHNTGLIGPIQASVHLTGWQRFYYGSEPEVGSDRRDTTLTATASLLYPGLFVEPLVLELSGLYERNWSNDDSQDYDGQTVALLLHWRF
jgi:hypothetical protein